MGHSLMRTRAPSTIHNCPLGDDPANVSSKVVPTCKRPSRPGCQAGIRRSRKIPKRWICPDIGEVQVLGHQHAVLSEASRHYLRVRCAADSLVKDRGRVMAGIREQALELDREVLVKLEPHGESLCAQGHYTLLGQLGGIVQGRLDCMGRNGWIALGNLIYRQSRSEVVQDDG